MFIAHEIALVHLYRAESPTVLVSSEYRGPMKKVRVSVAMATFNGEKYIEDQLQSIITQTRPVDEIIVSDGGSEDNTVNIIKEVCSTSGIRFTLLTSQSRLGVTENFNRALKSTTGDWVLLADQDDYWAPTKVEVLLPYFESSRCHLVVHDAFICDSRLNVKYSSAVDRYVALNLTSSERSTGCCMSLSRVLLEHALPIPSEVFHDVFLNSFARRAKVRAEVSQRLIYYRRHANTSSGYLPDSLASITRARKTLFRTRICVADLTAWTRPRSKTFRSKRVTRRTLKARLPRLLQAL
jgi:glycosyltransferase involved in cell wall biosynthesis